MKVKNICKSKGHDWLSNADRPYLRECSRCGCEEVVFMNRFPKIGESQYKWLPSPNQRMRELETLK